jgi:hypothetical protein
MLLLFGLAEEIYSTPFWGIVFGAAVFSLVAGLIVGAFSSPSSSHQAVAIDNSTMPSSLVIRAFRAFGRWLYRFLVGCFVGTIVTTIFSFVFFGLAYAGLAGDFDKIHGTLAALAGLCALMGSCYGGFVGALVAALFAVNKSTRRRLRIGKWVILGSIIGLFLGAQLAAGAGIIAAAVVGLEKMSEDKGRLVVFLQLAVGLVAGLLAGFLAAACSAFSTWSYGKPR